MSFHVDVESVLRIGENLHTVALIEAPDQVRLFGANMDDNANDHSVQAYNMEGGVTPDTVIFQDLTIDRDDFMEAGPQPTLDGWWKKDDIGYSFRHTITWADWDTNPVGGDSLMVLYRLLSTVYGIITLLHSVKVDAAAFAE